MLFLPFCWFGGVLPASGTVRKIRKRSLPFTGPPMWWSGCKSPNTRNYVTFTARTVSTPAYKFCLAPNSMFRVSERTASVSYLTSTAMCSVWCHVVVVQGLQARYASQRRSPRVYVAQLINHVQ